jgi:hypothetical protein
MTSIATKAMSAPLADRDPRDARVGARDVDVELSTSLGTTIASTLAAAFATRRNWAVTVSGITDAVAGSAATLPRARGRCVGKSDVRD